MNFANTRPGTGMRRAGGNLLAVRGADPCENPELAAGDPFSIAYVGPDLDELDVLGFEAIVIEDPSFVISAFLNEVNFAGGVHGRCLRLESHVWSLVDPITSFIELCEHLNHGNPVFAFSFQLYDSGLDCAQFGTPLPTIGLYAARPNSALVTGRGLLFNDAGSVEHILSVTVETATGAGLFNRSERFGLLHGTGPSAGMDISAAEKTLHLSDVDLVVTAIIPTEFNDLELLLPEAQTRLLQTGLSDVESESALNAMASLPPEQAEMLARIEQFFDDAATEFKEAGVTTVLATSHWSDVRRMMRAADRIDWTPTWVINDMQPSTLTTADAPRRQVQQLWQVSARRAAGDVVAELDRGCVTTRNTTAVEQVFSHAGTQLDEETVVAEPFAHRPHTDAWNLLMSVCDYLDVTLSALTRSETVTHLSFLEGMIETFYETEHGDLITFSSADRSGSDRFRVLQPDSDCVLNFWGCMRSTTDWLQPPRLIEHEEQEFDLSDVGGTGDMGDMDHSGHTGGMDGMDGMGDMDETGETGDMGDMDETGETSDMGDMDETGETSDMGHTGHTNG